MKALAIAVLFAGTAHAQDLPPRWPRAPLIDVARAQVGADVAAERHGLDGRGSALCLVDTGVDASQLRADQIAYWSDGGRMWRAPDLIGVPGDAHGHGTAMASIAVGRSGIAPAAWLFVVSAYDAALEGFPDQAVLDGVRFCRGVARDEGIEDRLVVLLSLGGHDGAHDGSGAFERALTLEARHVPIVVSAGNDGERAVHATGRAFDGERSQVMLYVPRTTHPDPRVFLTVRFDGDFVIRTPSGDATPSLALDREVMLDGAYITSFDRDGVRAITIAANGGVLASGEYAIELEGAGAFDVWLAGERLGSTFLPAGLRGPTVVRGEQIAIPATADGVIAVGATISRPSFGDFPSDGAVGDPSPFTSLGPSANGAPRPDIAAPGGWTWVALSSGVRDGDPANLVGGSLAPYRTDDGRIAIRGTSVSAAIVAGALLLAMQHGAPTADPRALLIASARGGGAWRPDVGFGELDVPALLERWSGARDAEVAAGTLSATRPFAPSDDVLWLVAQGRGANGLPAGDRLRVELGDDVWTTSLIAGTGALAIVPPYAQVGSTLSLRASIDGIAIDGTDVPVVIDRSPRAVRVAGGCAITPAHGGAWPAIALAFLCRRRSRARR